MTAAEALVKVADIRGVDVDAVFDGRLDVPTYHAALKAQGTKPAKITDEDRQAALRLSRERREARRQRQIADNSEPGCVLPWVVHGDMDLDPTLNPDHPISARKKADTVLVSANTRQEQVMKILKKVAEKLLLALGYKAAAKYNAEQMKVKLNALNDVMDHDDGEEKCKKDPALLKAFRGVMTALEKGQEVEVTLKDEAAEEAPKKPAAKNGAKKPAAKDEDDEDGDEEEEEEEGDEEEEDEEEGDEPEEEEEEEAKPKSKAPKKGAAKPKAKDDDEDDEKPKRKPPVRTGPTNMDTIIACLKKASAKKPTTVEQLHEACIEATGKCSVTTVKDALARDLKNRRQIEPEKNDKGWWLPK